MYADIDMKEQTFTPIGNQATLFVGEFDGQGHVISNLTVSGGDYTGLFGVVSGGADIRNFVLDKTCSISGGAFVGVIGGTNGTGNVYVTNVGNEGSVTGTAQNAAGILGVDMNWQRAVKGLVLLLAVIMDVVSKKKKGGKRYV